jgi:TetR/AcrR family transcriptional repressor of nem operon
MGISKAKAAVNRKAIIDAAGKLFRQKGVNAVGLEELMRAAGFSQGGFYNHFKSKNDLVAAVMEQAMQDGACDFIAAMDSARARDLNVLDHQVDWYLSEEHRAGIETGCPLTGFVGDISHMDAATQATYEQGLSANLERFAQLVAKPGMSNAEIREKALALFSEMVGALILSRAVSQTNPNLATEILLASRKRLHNAA